MSAQIQFILNALLLFGSALALTPILGNYIANIFRGEYGLITKHVRPFEISLYQIIGVDPNGESTWYEYTKQLLFFNFLGALFLFGLQLIQNHLPFNPDQVTAISADNAFNNAISFVTNSNWQAYSGESTMSHLTQMLGLGVQNFLSAATGLSVAIALSRSFIRHGVNVIGNFWVDLTRGTLYLLLPLAIIISIFFVSHGVIQNFNQSAHAQLVELQTYTVAAPSDNTTSPTANSTSETLKTSEQVIPMGPVASQEAIKIVGTNGGGFFNANSAHPFENPDPWTNLLQMLSILLIPCALTYAFGMIVGDLRQCWALLAAMAVLLISLTVVGYQAELSGNKALHALGVDDLPSLAQPGGNMEGKESRFGIAATSLYTAVTTGTSTGAVISSHDSLTPIGGLVPLVLIQLGELSPGGVGSGLYTILIYAILGVFIAGLMIGRTPEYLGKKIEAREMKLASIFILTTPFLVLMATAVAVVIPEGAAGVSNPGPHGFSEILYAYSSAANNNGSAFAGLNANTPFYNFSTGIAMWLGRFVPLIAALALAGSLVEKKKVPTSSGTMPTHGPLFVALLIGSIILLGVLTYLPAVALGPIVEHLSTSSIH